MESWPVALAKVPCVHCDLADVDEHGHRGREGPERERPLALQRVRGPPGRKVGLGQGGAGGDVVVAHEVAAVFADGLATVGEGEHPPGAEDVVQQGAQIPLVAGGGFRELLRGDAGTLT